MMKCAHLTYGIQWILTNKKPKYKHTLKGVKWDYKVSLFCCIKLKKKP